MIDRIKTAQGMAAIFAVVGSSVQSIALTNASEPRGLQRQGSSIIAHQIAANEVSPGSRTARPNAGTAICRSSVAVSGSARI
jgi:hypothetical protein